MNFDEAEKYLYSLGNEVDTMKLGLENIALLLNELGNPQNDYLKVQVAGTNGKGSVCAFLNSMCLRAQIRTGMYTSPHLVSIRERIKIDGADISEKNFADHATRVREISQTLVSAGKLESVPTFFEQVTAIALLTFAEVKVELAILETGLGGRFDATTAANAEIAAVTRIDLDHQEFLGESLARIAAEKAAIIRPGSAVVLLHQNSEVDRVLTGRCREVGVEPQWATREIEVKRDLLDPGMKGYIVARFSTEIGDYTNVLFFSMFGQHQIENASIAIGLAETLGRFGLEIDRYAVIEGIEVTTHPGRLEYIDNFLLDGAHNVSGARVLRSYLDEFVEKPITLVFGAMEGKPVGDILEVIAPRANSIILTKPNNTRAIAPEKLAQSLQTAVYNGAATIALSVEEAIEIAGRISGNGVILVTGSLYLVGDVKRLLEKKPAI